MKNGKEKKMIPQDFKTLIMDKTFKIIQDLSETKGKEYTQGEDRLKNFKDIANDLGIDSKAAWYVYFKKHIDAIKSYIKFNKSFSTETIESRIDDAILYLILLKGIIYEEKITISIIYNEGEVENI